MEEYFVVREGEFLVQALRECYYGYDSLESAKQAALAEMGSSGWAIVKVSGLEAQVVMKR